MSFQPVGGNRQNPHTPPRGKKICPFMSSGKDIVPCSPACMLYREGKQGSKYQCPFQELPNMSWNMSVALKNHTNGF
jgi:hypothetical protein